MKKNYFFSMSRNKIKFFQYYVLITVIIPCTFFFISCDNKSQLLLICQNGKYGFMDKTGKVVIHPQFDCAADFCDGLARVKIGEKYGYIDESGLLVIKPQFDEAYDFSDGRAIIRIGDYYGLISKSETEIKPPEEYNVFRFNENRSIEIGHSYAYYDYISGFSEDMAIVEIDGKYGYIDKKERIVIIPQFDYADDFSEGLASVGFDGKWEYIDKSGTIVTRLNADCAYPFSNGRARVRIGDKWSFIDELGVFCFVKKEDFLYKNIYDTIYQFDEADDFCEGFARVKVTKGYWSLIDNKWVNSGWQYIDKDGHINGYYDEAYNFSQGLARVKSISDGSYNGKWGFVEKSPYFNLGRGNYGRLLHYAIKPQFDDAKDFSEGLACVKIQGRWGYVDKKGKYVINPQFDEANDFSEGYASVRVGKEWYYIDMSGEIVSSPLPYFDVALPFSEGVALIRSDGKYRYIDKSMNFIGVSSDKDLTHCFDCPVIVGTGGKVGFVDHSGKFIRDKFMYRNDVWCYTKWPKIRGQLKYFPESNELVIPQYKYQKVTQADFDNYYNKNHEWFDSNGLSKEIARNLYVVRELEKQGAPFDYSEAINYDGKTLFEVYQMGFDGPNPYLENDIIKCINKGE